jgi:UDP-N-acetylmuramate dehydrogenase
MNLSSLPSDKPCPFQIAELKGQLLYAESLSQYTSWRVGGPAEWFYKPTNLADLMCFMRQLPSDMPIFWLGLGSNLLVRDGGIRGAVILTAGLLNAIVQQDGQSLWIEAGVSCPKIARFASRVGLSGVEFLAGIPGTFGGALAMNAGAFGGETWNWVREIAVLNRQGQSFRRSPSDYQIGYRTVITPADEWFVGARLQLTPVQNGEKESKIRDLLKQRQEKQPIGLPSCGSVFRNPPNDYAGRLIEQQGWKGRCVGGACVSEKHANFIINTGQATASEIESLIRQIQASVAQATGIQLATEVCIVGEQ